MLCCEFSKVLQNTLFKRTPPGDCFWNLTFFVGLECKKCLTIVPWPHWYQENSHPENFHQSNSPLVNSPRKIPTWNIPTHVFKYSHPGYLHSLFFYYCRRYRWYYLKDCFVILCFLWSFFYWLWNCNSMGTNMKVLRVLEYEVQKKIDIFFKALI